MTRRFLQLCCVLLCSSCVADLRGPDVDLGERAMPTSPPAPAVATPARPATQPPPIGSFRVWVPPQTEAHGDTAQGHFRLLRATPPPTETLAPAHPMPLVPAPGNQVKTSPKGTMPTPGPGTGTPPVALPPSPPVPIAAPEPPFPPQGLVPGAAGTISPQQMLDSLQPKGR